MRLRLFATLVAAPLIIWLALPLVSSGEPSQRHDRRKGVVGICG